MVMKRKQYTKEFKRQILELKEQGKTAKEISSEYGIDVYQNGSLIISPVLLFTVPLCVPIPNGHMLLWVFDIL